MRFFLILLLSLSLLACSEDNTEEIQDTLSNADSSADTSRDQDTPGGTATWGQCEYVGDCALTHPGCCALCERPSASDVVAINTSQTEAYRASECPEGAACPACEAPENPWLQATCGVGECRVVDVESEGGLRTCSEDEDCVMRVPECCECGADTSPERLIALAGNVPNVLGAYLNMVCDPRADCAACAAQYPETHEAFCDTGQCSVREIQ